MRLKPLHWGILALVLVVLVLGGVGLSQYLVQTTVESSSDEWIEGKPISHTPISPFPKAVRVELYAAEIEFPPEGGEGIPKREWRRTLTPKQRKAAEANIVITTYDASYSVAACCIPHHFFRYSDASGKQVGEVAICFCCGCARADPGIKLGDLQALEFKYAEMKVLISSLGIPTNIHCGSDAE